MARYIIIQCILYWMGMPPRKNISTGRGRWGLTLSLLRNMVMDTWNFNYGEKITDDLTSFINSEIDKRPFLSALVLSGGDPMYSAAEVKKFISMIHVPKNNIWCYSGFKIEHILKNPDMRELLTMCNVLVDGEFDINKRDITLSFRGSGNQRVIDVRKTLMKNKICLWNRR